MDPGMQLNETGFEASGGSGGASGPSGPIDEPIDSDEDYYEKAYPYRVQLGAGGLSNPSFKRKFHYLIVLSLLLALSREREIEQE